MGKKAKQVNGEKQNNQRYPQACLAACLLPWNEKFELDVPVFERHIQNTLDDGYRHIYLLGTASEGYALSESRFRQVVGIFASRTVIEGCDPQVGIIGTSMEHMIERIGYCHDLGIRMFQIVLPCWGALNDEEVLIYFKTICGEFPDCRFLHYNNIKQKRQLTGIDYRRIADAVPNLVATKNNGADYIHTANLITYSPDLQHFLLEFNYAIGCTVGECSLLNSYDIIFPELTKEFFEAGCRKDIAELFRITKIIFDAEKILFDHIKDSHIDAAFDKTLAWLRFPEFSNRLLPPYLGLSDEDSALCRSMYEKHLKHIR